MMVVSRDLGSSFYYSKPCTIKPENYETSEQRETIPPKSKKRYIFDEPRTAAAPITRTLNRVERIRHVIHIKQSN